jgi:segregation and condensation protein B
MDDKEIKYFLEAALLAAGRPLNIDQLKGLFDGRMAPEKNEIRKAIATLNDEYDERGIIVSEVASGFRMQVKASMAGRLERLWEERPPRYSRALFETLALIAYRQPITRGEIEEIRGVSVSSNITRQLLDREWVRVVGHRDVPGRPAMFGTTREFLDYFGLKKLDDLPPLADLSDWESLRVQLNLPEVEGQDGSEEFVLEGALDADSAADTPVLYSQGGVETLADSTPENQEEAATEEILGVETSDEEELVVSERSSPVG